MMVTRTLRACSRLDAELKADSLSNPLIAKMERGADLTAEDRAMLDALVRRPRPVAARKDIIHEGDAPSDVQLVLEGWACRYKQLPNGRRQIMAFLVPGDFCDFHIAILGAMDHGIMTLTPCTMARIPRETIEDLTTHPRISRALWWCTLVDEAILREWLVNMGRRPAVRRTAHLLCELLVRLQSVSRATDNSYEFRLTQTETGDAMGLTVVHVNRSLQHLRQDGLIILKDGLLTVPDVVRLKEYAGFNPNYLHLTARPNGGPALAD